MPGVMSVTLKASVNSSLVAEGDDGFGKAEGLTGFHAGITSRVALQPSVAAEHRAVPASVADTHYPKQEALCVFPLDCSLFKRLSCYFM